MTQALATTDYNPLAALVDEADDRNTKTRLGQFVAWQTGRHPWWQPDLAAYRDDLLRDGLQPVSVQSYLATIRGAYRRILASNRTRDALYAMVGGGTVERWAAVNEIVARIENAISPLNAPVDVETTQDDEHLRLTAFEAVDLLRQPGTDTLTGLRDTTILAVFLCTGIREAELVSLTVDDLWNEYDGELALRVRHGKGNKRRWIPYGGMSWCLRLVEKWMLAADIESGVVFRGFYPDGTVRPDGLSTRSVRRLVKKYGIYRDGKLLTVQPHDLRRTYARLQWEAGMDLASLQQNLGHSKPETTMAYIGKMDAEARRARPVFRFDV